MANNSASYNVNMRFTADTGQAKQQLSDLQRSLDTLMNQVATKNVKFFDVNATKKEIDEASAAVQELKIALDQATNVNTGRLDLSKFSKSLSQSGYTLQDFATHLENLGPTGDQAFVQLAQSVINAEVPLKRTNALLDNFKKTLANTVKWQISSNIMHGVQGSLQRAYYYAEDLNKSLNEIRIVTGQNSDQMAQFAEKANKAAQALSTTTTNYTNASLIYYQQGLSNKEVEDRTAVTIKMANAAGESASKVSDQLTAVWNNFYNGSKSLEYYADVMTKLGAYTASSTDEISAGIQKFASVANTIGLSYEYATSALATLTARTRESADTVGNSLKTLFARIQGLTLGETLEDGTDLNKYSKALDKVGISIKDQQGELKDMNTILDEMMGKWDSLSRAEQVALAQTVGGVRQYTQLINLMKNKDYFRELVGVAENSEGTLTEQANIYAESWEASKKRVQAALEEIYKQLVNDKFFIGLNDTLTGTLNISSKLIDSLGGLPGVLSVISSLMLKSFGPDIANNMQRIASNLFIDSRAAQNQAAVMKQQIINQLQSWNQAGDGSLPLEWQSSVTFQNSTMIEAATQSYDLQLATERLNDTDRQRLSILKQISDKYADIAYNARLGLEQANNNAITARREGLNRIRALEGDSGGAEGVAMASTEIDSASYLRDEYVDFMNSNIDDFDNQELINRIGYLNLMGESYETLNNHVEQYSLATDEASKKTIGNQIRNDLRNLQHEYGQTGTTLQMLNQFTDNYIDIQEENGIISREQAIIMKQVVASLNEVTIARTTDENSVKQYQNAVEQFNNALARSSGAIMTFSQGIVSGAQSLSQFAIGANSIRSAIETLNNQDLTFGEKVLQMTTSISIAIPSIINGFTNLQKSIQAINNSKNLIGTNILQLVTGLNEIKGANLVAELERLSATSNTTGLRFKVLSSMTNAYNNSLSSAEIGVNGLTQAMAEQTAGTIALNAGIKTVMSSLKLYLGIGVAIITAVSLIVAAHDNYKKRLEETSERTKEQADALQEEYNANKELVKSYEDALKAYGETNSEKTNLISTGQKLIEAYKIENGNLLLLTGQYEKLAEAAREAAKAQAENVVNSIQTAYNAQEKSNKVDVKHDEYFDRNGKYLQYDYSPQNFVNTYKRKEQERSNYKEGSITLKEINNWLTDNKELYEKNKEIVDDYTQANLTYGYLLQDWNNVKSSGSFNEQQDAFIAYMREKFPTMSDKELYSSVNGYLQKQDNTANWASLTKAVEQFSQSSGIKSTDLYNNFTDEELKNVISLNPILASSDMETLRQQAEDYSKTHPINLSTSLKEAKEKLKDEMGDKDWDSFFEKSSDITWGKDGIVSKDSFKSMLSVQREAYLNNLIEQKAQNFTPEKIQVRTQERINSLQRDLNTKKDEELQNLYQPTEQDITNHDQYQSFINKLDEIKDEAPAFYNYASKQLESLKYNSKGLDLIISNIKDNYSHYMGDFKNVFTKQDIDNLNNQDLLTSYSNVETNRRDRIKIEEKYAGISEELNEEIWKEQVSMAKQVRDYYTSTSNTIAQMSAQDLSIGDIVEPDVIARLQQAGIEIDDYFIKTESGTYKLVQSAEELNRVLSKISIEHAYDGVANMVNNLYGSGHSGSSLTFDEKKAMALAQANRYLDYSNEQIASIDTNFKRDYISKIGLNIDDFETLDEAFIAAAQLAIDTINQAEYDIDFTVNNSGSMNEFEQNAKEANWNKTDKKYTEGMLNYQAENGNGLGRDEAINLNKTRQEYDKAQENLQNAPSQAEVDAAEEKYKNASNTGDKEVNRANYNELLKQRKLALEEVNKAQQSLVKSTDDLSKKMKKSDFTDALKNVDNYIKALNKAKKNTDDYEIACDNIASALSKAFDTTVTDEFVKKNEKLIKQMMDPNGTDASREAGANSIGLHLKVDEEQAKGELTTQLQNIDNSIDTDSIFTNLSNINLDAEGHIVMTGESGQAVAAIGQVIAGLGSGEEKAKMMATLLNSILGTNIDFEANMDALVDMAKAMSSEDPNALVQWAEKYPDFSASLKTSADSLAPDLEGWPGMTSGGGGGSSSKKSASDIGKEIQDKRIAVNEKKRELLETKREGANPEDAQKYIKEEIDLLEEEQQLLEEQIKSWKTLLKTKVQEFNAKHPELEITLDDNGEIANASELWGKVWAEYEKNMQEGMSGEELNEWFTKISNDINGPMGIQENIDENVAAIAQKEKEQAELELESITKAIDWKVKQIDFQIKRLNYYQEKLLKQAHGNKQTIEAMLEGFAYQEQEMLQLFNKGATLRSGIDQLNSAKAQYPDYAQMFDEQILDYQSDLIDVNEAILDLRNDIEDLVQNVMDLALDEIDKQIERLDTYTSMLDHLNNIIDLSGRSMLDMGLKTQIGATKVQTMIGKMTTLKGQMDGLVKAQKEAEAALADRRADGDESSVKFWENQVEVIKQEVEKASDEFLGSWEETLEAAQDLFEMRVEMAVNTLSNALSPFETLEDFQDKYEKAKTINDQYLDDAERLYELSKLNRQLNLQMKDTDDLLAQEKLKEIQKEINDLQADSVQMSQYDLEYLQKKYDLQLAEIALMEQQNSKTSMRLVRDAAGNWTYAYDADEEKIEDATQKYEDAVHDLGELSKDYINDVSEQLIQNQIDFKEALQDLDKNSADYSNQLLSLQEYYVERQRYLLDELNKGVVNSGLTFHDTLYGQMTDLYDYNDAYMQFVNNSNVTISELQTNYKDWQKVVETAMNVAGTSWDNFGSDMGGTLDSLEEHIQKLCDEIEELVDVLMGYISQSIGMVLDWEQKYSKRTDQELAKNESYIDGNFSGGGGYYSQKVDMQTDFTRLLARWDAGERNLSNFDGSKIYTSESEIAADLQAKLDAAGKGEKIKYEGSGENYSDEKQQETLDKFKGYNSQGGRYGSYPNTYSNNIVDKASNYLGTKYTYGGKDASTGLDCSGLVYKALNDAGVNVPALTAEGYKQMAKSVSQANAKPGDLVFFGANGVSDHVGIYMGNGQMINATGTKTQITNIDTKKAGLIGYGRIGNSNNLPSADSVIQKFISGGYNGAASGAYTGDWGPGQGLGIDNGKIIKVHPKELILNKSDTKNILRAVDIVRDMNNWVDDQIKRMNQQSQSVISNLMTDVIPSTYNNQPIQQEVNIEANFPGVTDHYEIEEALSNLSNDAAQYISANKNR